MTLNKAIQELFAELNRTDLTEEEKKALEKYKTWLCSIKGTVSNNTQYWHPYPLEKPTKRGQYITTALDPNTNEPYVIACRWYKTNDGNYDWAVVKVIAWKELPKPFDSRFWV